jgi:hypothetical protein
MVLHDFATRRELLEWIVSSSLPGRAARPANASSNNCTGRRHGSLGRANEIIDQTNTTLPGETPRLRQMSLAWIKHRASIATPNLDADGVRLEGDGSSAQRHQSTYDYQLGIRYDIDTSKEPLRLVGSMVLWAQLAFLRF